MMNAVYGCVLARLSAWNEIPDPGHKQRTPPPPHPPPKKKEGRKKKETSNEKL